MSTDLHAKYPYISYRQRRIEAQEGLDDTCKRFLSLVLMYDRKNNGRGCPESLTEIGNFVGWHWSKVKWCSDQLRASGHLITLGRRKDGKALRRIRLKEDFDPKIWGAMIPFEHNGGIMYRKRKKGEKNMAVFTPVSEETTAVLAPPTTAVIAPPHYCRSSLAGTEKPISFSDEKDLISSLSGSAAGTDDPRMPQSAATPPPSAAGSPEANPSAPPPPEPKAGRIPNGQATALFSQLEIAPLLLAHFGVAELPYNMAKAVVRMFRKGKATDAGMRFVLRHFLALPTEPGRGVRRPNSVEAFIKNWVVIRDFLVAHVSARLRCDLTSDMNNLHNRVHPSAQLAEAKSWIAMYTCKSYRDFQGPRSLAWAAAYHFESLGEDTKAVDGGRLALLSAVRHPEVYHWAAHHLKFDIARVTGRTLAETGLLRIRIVEESKKAMFALHMCPTVDRVTAAEGTAEEYTLDRVTWFLEDAGEEKCAV
jgi:hypothetical protein